VLGVSPVLGSRRNPLDFHTRERMIRKAYPEVVVLPLADHPLDTLWSANLDTLLANTFPGTGFTLYGSRDSFVNYYSGKNAVKELTPNGQFSASEIRESIREQVMDSVEFRSGVIYAYANTYPKVYPTVDVALFRNNKTEILLGKKENDGAWRLIGGFTDPTDDGFETAARRELEEECGIKDIADMQYVGSFRVDDWRYRSETDKIITTLFSADIVSGEPQASDDIVEVKWFPIQDLRSLIANSRSTPTHTVLLEAIIKKYSK
jgi:bifunctional NMN adenylyltransferase/nudix hydrolase